MDQVPCKRQRDYSIFARFILLVPIVVLLTACELFLDYRGVGYGILDHQYQIDSQTILSSIRHGEKDIFNLIDATPGPISNDSGIPVLWTQEDYLLIAQSIHELIWQESMDQSMDLAKLIFCLDCGEVNFGPQIAQIQLHKLIGEKKEIGKENRYIVIAPKANLVYITDYIYQPVLRKDWGSIDLSNVKISAEEALQIAELSGGKEMRAETKNQCSIGIVISADGDNSAWLIYYTTEVEDPSLSVEFRIDSVTGECKNYEKPIFFDPRIE